MRIPVGRETHYFVVSWWKERTLLLSLKGCSGRAHTAVYSGSVIKSRYSQTQRILQQATGSAVSVNIWTLSQIRYTQLYGALPEHPFRESLSFHYDTNGSRPTGNQLDVRTAFLCGYIKDVSSYKIVCLTRFLSFVSAEPSSETASPEKT